MYTYHFSVSATYNQVFLFILQKQQKRKNQKVVELLHQDSLINLPLKLSS